MAKNSIADIYGDHDGGDGSYTSSDGIPPKLGGNNSADAWDMIEPNVKAITPVPATPENSKNRDGGGKERGRK